VENISIFPSLQVKVIVQVNGRKETEILANKGIHQKEVEELAKSDPKIKKILENKTINKTIFIENKENKLINFVIK